MRLSISHKRDEVLFTFFKQEIEELYKLEERGDINVVYYDEMGINLSPVVPYGYPLSRRKTSIIKLA